MKHCSLPSKTSLQIRRSFLYDLKQRDCLSVNICIKENNGLPSVCFLEVLLEYKLNMDCGHNTKRHRLAQGIYSSHLLLGINLIAKETSV